VTKRHKAHTGDPLTGRAARRANGQRGPAGEPMTLEQLPIEVQLQYLAHIDAQKREAERAGIAARASLHARGMWLPGDDEYREEYQNDNPYPE
jgi:hypothetical protein